MSAVPENSINWGHRIQLHHTAILSTWPRYMDRIIREWWSTVSTGGTASSYTTLPSSPPEPDTWIASSGSGREQYELVAPHPATPHRHPLHQAQIRVSHHQGVAENNMNLGSPHPAIAHRQPLHQTQIHGSHNEEGTETEIHSNSVKMEVDFCLSNSRKPLICCLKDRKKPPSHDSRAGFSAAPHIALLRVRTMSSLGTQQLWSWCPAFIPLTLFSHPPACQRLTQLISLPYTSVLCPTHHYTFPCLLLNQPNHPFSEPS
jgi:hypothetical protein